MKHLIVGNGINIQFSGREYTAPQIVYRVLKNCDRDDFPTHIIVDSPYLLKDLLGRLYLEIRNVVNGEYDQYANCTAERNAINSFKEQYSDRTQELNMTDIGFEDYYLVHDLVCHKHHIGNPDMFYTREAMRIAYLFAIYNDGKVNKIYEKYPHGFINCLNMYTSVFTTNYDSNLEAVYNGKVFHIHGQFDKLSEVYNRNSFRNQLPDAPIKDISVDPSYLYLYSNALSTHCGEYKQLQINQAASANSGLEKLTALYLSNPAAREQIDSWTHDSNKLTANLGYAIQLKAKNPELKVTDDYHFSELSLLKGSIDILGLSPWNDFHIFETIDSSNIDCCTYYYYSEDQCAKVSELLPTLNQKKSLRFASSDTFWRNCK